MTSCFQHARTHAHNPASSSFILGIPREGAVLTSCLPGLSKGLLKVPNDDGLTHCSAQSHVSLSSHLELLYSYEPQPGSGLHDKKNSILRLSGRTRIPLITHCLAQFYAFVRSKVHTHAPITRALHSLGWARVCGWGCK